MTVGLDSTGIGMTKARESPQFLFPIFAVTKMAESYSPR
jgi:hypothetical protein